MKLFYSPSDTAKVNAMGIAQIIAQLILGELNSVELKSLLMWSDDNENDNT